MSLFGVQDEVSQLLKATDFLHGEPVANDVIWRSGEAGQDSIEKRLRYRTVFAENHLDATAVFELAGSPCIYFVTLEDEAPSPSAISGIQRRAWHDGRAPVVWVVTPTQVTLVNAYAPPATEGGSSEKHVIGVFKRTAHGLRQLREIAGRAEFASGRFWHSSRARQIDRRYRVDQLLLANLSDAENALRAEGFSAGVAHTLLSRSLLLGYLHDRRKLFASSAAAPHDDEQLSRMFDSNPEGVADVFERISDALVGDLITPAFLEFIKRRNGKLAPAFRIIGALLGGTRLRDGQTTFLRYRFDSIPVEMISSIYEHFSHATNKSQAKIRSTHYTPLSVVNLILSQVAPRLAPDAKVLDPACGSGVFLVETLRQLVASRLAVGETLDGGLIRRVLGGQIFGIDVNREAVDLAAYSLCLAVLDLEPESTPLSRIEPLIGKNLFASDFFDTSAEFNARPEFIDRQFGAVVGNPPWTRNKFTKSASEYLNVPGRPVTRKSIDQGFLWRIGDFVNDETHIGIVVGSRPYFSTSAQAKRARRALFERFSPRAIINLSELRQDGLFPTATAPATVLICWGRRLNGSDTLRYVTARRDRKFRRHGMIQFAGEDVRSLSAPSVACEPFVLKVASYGGARDLALMRRLHHTFDALSKVARERHWDIGQGFQTAKGSERIPSELVGKPWLRSGEMGQFHIDASELPPLPYFKLHRLRDVRIYSAPLVITTRSIGVTGWRAALATDDIVYTELYFGVSVPREDLKFARILSLIFNAKLATYWLFMSSGAWAVERDEVKPSDVKLLPIIRLDEADDGLINDLLALETDLKSSSVAHECRAKLDELVYKLYGLSDTEICLVEDAMRSTIPQRFINGSAGPSQVSSEDIQAYRMGFEKVLDQFLHRQNLRAYVQPMVFSRSDLGILRVTIIPRNAAVDALAFSKLEGATLEVALAEISRNLGHEVSKDVWFQRSLRIYTPGELFIVKPLGKRYWTQSSGFQDADLVLLEHLRK